MRDKNQENLLLTGSTGFVGRRLLKWLVDGLRFNVTVAVRNEVLGPEVHSVVVGNIDFLTDWEQALLNVSIVVHVAGRAHIMRNTAIDPYFEFRKVNTKATLNLARQAAEQGVKRFVFISSIKVNGESTKLGIPFKPDDSFIPEDPYGLSKYEAEQGLLALAKETGMEVVIIRPPLVYGPKVCANFATMMSWVDKGIPLPFGVIHNKRSLIALDNLVGFIVLCIDHPKAANEIFLISDGDDVSTSELLYRVAKAFGKKGCLIDVPVCWMKLFARWIGKEHLVNRLFCSLQVDSSKAYEMLGWKSVITMDEQLKKTVEVYLNEKIV